MSHVTRQRRVLVAHPGGELYGSDRMLLESVAGMLDEGWLVLVALPESGPLASELRRLGATVTFCPTPVLRKSALRPAGLAQLLGQTLRSVHPTRRLLRMSKPDAVYVSTVTAPLWITLSWLQGTYTVTHVHEAERPRAAGMGRALAAPLMLSDRVLVNSRYSAEALHTNLRQLRGRTELVRNGVLGPVAAQPPRPCLDGPLRVLFAGRLSPRKGPQVALEAVRQLRHEGVPVVIRIVGEAFRGYEWFADKLREDFSDLTAAGVLEFRGFQDDIWPELEWCDVAVVPSILPEPFGNAAVEAVLAARPVVASDIGGLPEAVAGVSSAIVVAPDDPEALAHALAQIRTRWPEFAAAAVLSGTRARERFHPQRYRDAVGAAVAKRQLPSRQKAMS